jgi:uncharacterized phiE125 gp8 family phage protein
MPTVTVTTPPGALAVTLADAKLHLRVDHPEEDALITSLVTAATEYLERVYDRALIDQSISVSLDGFPANDGPIKLYRGPIKTGTVVVTYTDTLGAPTAYTTFQVDLSADLPRIAPDASTCYPCTQSGALNPLTIAYDAGLGVDSTAVPERYQQAIKLLVGHWYTNRESVVIGTISAEVEQTLDMLMWHDRVFEFAKAG